MTRSRSSATLALVTLIALVAASASPRTQSGSSASDSASPKLAAYKTEAAANIDTIVKALFFSGGAPKSLGDLEKALAVRAPIELKKFWPR